MRIIKFIPIVIALLITQSCLRPVGECTYGKEAPLKGEVVIVSVSEGDEPSKNEVIVSVDGFFKKRFVFSREDFERCFTAKNYRAGSKLEGLIIRGGPCPPMYRLADCNQ